MTAILGRCQLISFLDVAGTNRVRRYCPGLSPSNLLLYLGLFDPMLAGFKRADISVFLPIALGGMLTLILFSKLMNYLLHHYYAKVYHFILGIVVVSTL